MSEISSITNSTTSMLVTLALNASSAKHMAIAQNIANVNTEGYRPLQVDFDAQVALFKDQLLNRGNDAAAGRAIEALRAGVKITEAPEAQGKVQLDAEVAKMTQNAIHYQTLLTARSKLSSLVRMAISGGR